MTENSTEFAPGLAETSGIAGAGIAGAGTAGTAPAGTAAAVEAQATETGGAQGAGGGPEIEDVLEALRDVVDPELGVNVVDLGLVYGVTVESDRTATIDMTLTSAACPLTDVIEDQTQGALDGLVQDFRINWVWLPPWGPEKITEDGREQLRALGFNV
jgi:metal-sulfur cluster biosynthetic enzyme